MKEREIIYEPHPVSAERKAELRAQGYKIIDAVFKPAENEAEPKEQRKPRVPRKAQTEA